MANWSSMFLKKLGKKRRTNTRTYFFKLIWLGCISVCIPVILASVAYYQFSTHRMQKYIQAESDSSLTIMKDRAETVLQEIEQDSLQLANDPFIQQEFTDPQDESGILKLDILKKIALVKNFNSFISEIYLYNSTNNEVISNEYGSIEKEYYKYKQNIDELLAIKRPTQWTQLKGKAGYITFYRKLPLIGTEGPKGVLGFEIEAAKLSTFMETDTVMLTGDQGLMIVKLNDPFGIERNPQVNQAEETARLKGIAMIKASDQNSGIFVAEGIDGKPAQYHYVKNVFSRTYVSVTPEQVITDQLSWIREMTVLIVLVFVGVGILLTYITSKRAYTPIGQLINHSRSLRGHGVEPKEDELDIIKESLDYLSNETEKLESYVQNMEPSLREKFLFKLLSGDYTANQTLLQDCLAYGIGVGFTSVVLVVDADHIYKEKRFLPEEKGIVAFSLANVMQELLNQHSLEGYVIPYQGRGVAILQFKPEMEQQTMKELTSNYAYAMIEAFHKYLSFEVNVCIGRFYPYIADVPVSYKEAIHALQYRIFRDAEPLLFIDDFEHGKTQSLLRYPVELQEAILHALEQEDLSTAIQHFEKFTEILRHSQSYVFIYQSYHIFLSAFIVSLEKQGANVVDIMEHNFFGQLRNKQTSKEMTDWFEESLFPVYLWLTKNDREASGESAIQWVCQYIHNNYGNDLSLVHCAERVGVSPSYLSRLFKKKVGKNFLEYVVETKIGQAERLLKDTDQSISEVATAIGYSERNFIRIFQRHVRMTPGQFRSQFR
ncbi:helix-turn-helix domain-containing protein [Paenibacillus anseongense]|uniref:helix-turn-helix domain-containing protein n=1 Tax=Paenibacillus TaxID=44249 RepID=UPI002DBB0572|nr:helix-turn-helix domain-containing protein [Paenibacillus anseongense]MEC0266889.1 helix-turn-helix domain-containing protein [Paenibacillus anseongense]